VFLSKILTELTIIFDFVSSVRISGVLKWGSSRFADKILHAAIILSVLMVHDTFHAFAVVGKRWNRGNEKRLCYNNFKC